VRARKTSAGTVLEADKAEGKKQRHTAKRIFERLRDEHNYTGGYTIVKDYVRLRKLSQREMTRQETRRPTLAKRWW
jgi:hypothetical protein